MLNHILPVNPLVGLVFELEPRHPKQKRVRQEKLIWDLKQVLVQYQFSGAGHLKKHEDNVLLVIIYEMLPLYDRPANSKDNCAFN